MHDLGDTVTIARTCRDTAGQPANATTVALTVTKPDGTTDTPVVANPPAQTGQYTVAYVPTQEGRHVWRITFTGAVPDQAHADVFHVWPSVSAWIVGLVEAKDHLNIAQSDTSQDEELRRAIAGASAVVEDIVGVVARRSFVQQLSGRGISTLLLSRLPVISVTSVVEDSVSLSASDYSITEHGVLTRLAGGVKWRWPMGTNNIVVTTVAGRPVVADNILDGTRDLIRVNFRPQLGGNRSPFDTATERQAEPGQMRLGFFVPNSVMERLHGSARGPHVA